MFIAFAPGVRYEKQSKHQLLHIITSKRSSLIYNMIDSKFDNHYEKVVYYAKLLGLNTQILVSELVWIKLVRIVNH